MAFITRCDRCAREHSDAVPRDFSVIMFPIGWQTVEKAHLCPDCVIKLHEFLRPLPKNYVDPEYRADCSNACVEHFCKLLLDELNKDIAYAEAIKYARYCRNLNKLVDMVKK